MNDRRKVWSISWRLGVCVLLLLWIFHAIFMNEGRQAWQRHGWDWSSLSRTEQWQTAWRYGPGQLWDAFQLIHLKAFLMSVFLVGLSIILGVLRWQMVLEVQGLLLPLTRATGISMVAQFFNSFLLGSTGGDLLKAFYAARETHHKKTEAVVTVFVDRLIGLFAMLLFACIMILPNLSLVRSDKRLMTLAALIVLMTMACGGVVVLAFWGGVSRTLPRARQWLQRLPKGELIERSLQACRRFGQERHFLSRTLILSMGMNAVCVWQVEALVAGLHLNIPSRILYMVVPMIICISALPITPSGLGVRENLYVLILTLPQIGIEDTKALTLSLLAFAAFLTWSIVGGGFYLGMRRSQHLDEVTKVDAVVEG